MNKIGIQHKEVTTLSALTDYSTESINKQVIARYKGGDIILMAFTEEQGLKEHKAPVDAIVQVIEGKGRYTIDGKDFELSAGEMIIMPANVPHAVTAITRFKMLLTKIKNQ